MEMDVGDEDLAALRKELGEAGIAGADLSDEQLRALGGRLGAWTVVVHKRQRQSKH